MFKFVCFTDLHLGVHGNSSIWLDSSLILAKELVEFAKEKNCKDVLFLGDLFHERRAINNKTLNVALDFCNIFENENITLHLLVGNHDTYFKNTLHPHSLSIFKKFKNINVIEDITKLNDLVTMVPYGLDWKMSKTPYVFGHFDINGCSLSENFTESNSEYNIEDFIEFNQVFTGHYHTPSIFKNINYIGSVMPFTFHDTNSKRGYYYIELKDEKTFSMNFKEFTSCPKFNIIYSNEDFTIDKIKGNVIKLIYTEELSTIDSETLVNKIMLCEPILFYSDYRLVVDDTSTILEDTLDEKKIKSNQDLLYEYIDKIENPSYIKINTLKNIIKSLLE